VHARTLARFSETFAKAGFSATTFYPCYGLAESTLFVTGGKSDAPPVVRSFDKSALGTGHARVSTENAIELVGSGSEFGENTLRIVDPQTLQEVSAGSVGEIWVSSPSNGRGYWRLPDESEKTFGAYIASTREGPFLRTGDLGFIDDGQLFVTGRVKDIIIMYGANHYPQDIERTVEQSHRALRWNSNAAFATHTPEHERLVVVQELDPRAGDVDQEEVVRSVRQAVAETHQIQVHSVVLIKPGTIYRTSSGKIQRSACKASYLDSTLQVI
jgi:acyl-CoA synthetase (AMP-forming)/AMP-acid ligase II